MPIADPTPTTWSLRFKSHKTTIILFVDRMQTFHAIKTELLHALSETSADGQFNDIPIPSNPDDVLFAKPVDFNNPDAGWQSLEADALGIDDELFGDEGNGKGKGKAKAKGAEVKDCPLGVGLRDGCAVAFKFKGQKPRKKTPEPEADEGLGFEEDEPKEWDVILPQYEDVYGLENLEPDPVEGDEEGDTTVVAS